ncbi:unnamed protein product [Arabis nemorensis]|uniref:Uncharacterized protein n=1 Tax=Arabis nemorensis TaxID=586526 RepID=A0A565CFG6_9BRAS|nr:unnamed protein product [Arabis nemorensis]
MEYFNEEPPYQADEDQWSQIEESFAFFDEEVDYEFPPWPEDCYPSFDYEEETDVDGYNSEPLDVSQDNASHTSWSREIETNQGSDIGETDEGDPWIEESDFQFSPEEVYEREEDENSEVCHEEERNSEEDKEVHETESWHEEVIEES